MEIVKVVEEQEEEEEEQLGMKQIHDEGQLLVEDEMHNIRSPLILSPPDVRKTFSEPTECSRSNQGNAEIMDMLVSMKKEIEEERKVGATTEDQRRISGG